MLTLLQTKFGNRDFRELDPPLRFSFETMVGLVDQSDYDRLEDVAARYFEAEAQWDRWSQLRRSVAWLSSVPDDLGRALALALRRSGAREYYQRQMGETRIRSDALARELGR